MAYKEGSTYEPLGGVSVVISDASVEQTGLEPGASYDFVATGGTALCRWDTTAATAADGGYTFAVPPGTVVRVRNPADNTLLNVIEAEAGSTATAILTFAKVIGS